MSWEDLIACLQAYPRPADAESWVVETHLIHARQPDPAYREAVKDVLESLGVLREGRCTSAAAYLFVRSLLQAVHEGGLAPAVWGSAKSSSLGATGATLLAALEQHRLNAQESATPLRRVVAVMSVIKGRAAEGDVFLMQYDSGSRWYQPIGGKRDPEDESNIAALARELQEELNLPHIQLGRDFQVTPLREDIHERSVSKTLNVLTEYSHNFYYVNAVRFALPTDSETRWLTLAEIQAGRAADGRAVSPLLRLHVADRLAGLPYSLSEGV